MVYMGVGRRQLWAEETASDEQKSDPSHCLLWWAVREFFLTTKVDKIGSRGMKSGCNCCWMFKLAQPLWRVIWHHLLNLYSMDMLHI